MVECPYCKCKVSVKVGFRKNKSGLVRKYKCTECKRSYTPRNGFEKMRVKPEVIIAALDLRAKGLSFGKIQQHLIDNYNVKVDRSAILYWQKKFGEMVENFTKQFYLESSENSHADEVFLRVKGAQKDDFIYYWDCIDYDTKFLTADHLSEWRDETEGYLFMKKLRARIKERPKNIHTDNSYDYPPAIRRAFGTRKVKHVHFPSWKREFKNNPIERFHNTLKENYKIMRRFDNFDSARRFLTFFRNYYNFIRRHKSLDWQTPAEKAGFGRWTWKSLIKIDLF